MAYESMIGIVVIGVHFVIAYLASQFNQDQIILQTFFLILAVGMTVLDFGIMIPVLTEAGATANVIRAVTAGFGMAIFVTVTFIAYVVLTLIKKSVLMPIQDHENPYKNWEKERMMQ